MGNCISTNSYQPIQNNICNYDCPICKQSDKLPNLKGRFFLIDEFRCQCNGCNNIFDKFLYYKNIPPIVESSWSEIYVEATPFEQN